MSYRSITDREKNPGADEHEHEDVRSMSNKNNHTGHIYSDSAPRCSRSSSSSMIDNDNAAAAPMRELVKPSNAAVTTNDDEADIPEKEDGGDDDDEGDDQSDDSDDDDDNDDDEARPSVSVSDASSDEFELLPTQQTPDVNNNTTTHISSIPPLASDENNTAAIVITPSEQQPQPPLPLLLPQTDSPPRTQHSPLPQQHQQFLHPYPDQYQSHLPPPPHHDINPSGVAHAPNLKSAQARERKRQSRKRARQAAARRARGNTSVYVQGLPTDVTEEELQVHFSKCGLLLPDARTGRGRIKIYVDEEGRVKGDALVTYALRPSVENAIAILDGAPLRPPPPEDFKLVVEQARFEEKNKNDIDEHSNNNINNSNINNNKRQKQIKNDDGQELEHEQEDEEKGANVNDNNNNNSSSKSRNGHVIKNSLNNIENTLPSSSSTTTKKIHVSTRDLIADALAWDDGDVSQMRKGLPRIVILKNVFSHHATIDYSLIEGDMYEGCAPCGGLEKVTVFKRSGHGAVAVKFQGTPNALKCIQVMNGRWYDGRQLMAELYDGKTDYRYKETEADREERDRQWQAWLEGGSKHDGNNNKDGRMVSATPKQQNSQGGR